VKRVNPHEEKGESRDRPNASRARRQIRAAIGTSCKALASVYIVRASRGQTSVLLVFRLQTTQVAHFNSIQFISSVHPDNQTPHPPKHPRQLEQQVLSNPHSLPNKPTMHFPTTTALLLAASAASAAALPTTNQSANPSALARRAVSGKSTFYGGNVQGGTCSFSTYKLPAGLYGTAFSGQAWDSAANCGGCVKVSHGGKSIVAMVSTRNQSDPHSKPNGTENKTKEM
jgi:hypothetical protein